MKKLLTLAVLALSAIGLYAQDYIVDTWDGDFSSDPGTMTGTNSGATYNGSGFTHWWAPGGNSNNEIVTGYSEDYFIRKVTISTAKIPSFTLYASNEPLTRTNYTSAPYHQQFAEVHYQGQATVDEGDYHYFAIVQNTPSEGYLGETKFYWEAPAAGAVTGDSFTVASFEEKKPSLEYESTSFSDRKINDGFSITLESGAQYWVKGMFAKKSEGWWALDNSNFEDPAYVTVTAPAENMWIESVDIVASQNWGTIGFGTQELTPENYEGNCQYENYSLPNSDNAPWPNTKHSGKLKPQQPTKYLYYNTNGQQFYDITVNWTAEKPSYTVADPDISCGDAEPSNASTIYYNCATRLAKVKIDVYTKDEGAADFVKNEAACFTTASNYGQFAMPGLPGQTVKIVATGVLEGCEDSAPVEKEFGPLAQADAPKPILPNRDRYVMPGGKVSVVVCKSEWGRPVEPIEPIEGAKVKYQYTIKDAAGETVSTSEEVTGTTNPVEITVPATAVPGQTFELKATTVMAYRNETSDTFSLPVISDVCPAPTFSVPSGSDMLAGKKIQVIKPEFADSLFYTVNGGEVMGENYTAEVTIDKETVIEAWCTAKNLKPSEHVTGTFKIEVLEAWMDALIPSNFEANVSDSPQSYPAEDRNYTSTSTNVSYLYNGKFMDDWSSFSFETNGYTKQAFNFGDVTYYMTNTTAYDKKSETQIKSIKVDCGSQNDMIYVAFSNDAFTAPTADSDICKEEYTGNVARVSVGGLSVDKKDYAFGEWIELKGLKNVEGDGTKYFMVFAGDGNYPQQISRVVVHYWDPKDGVSSIVTEEVEGAVYSINGYRVNSENLAPGVYVRKQNGKTVKFVVK